MLFRTPVMLLIFFFFKSPYLHVVNVKFWPYHPNDPQQKLRFIKSGNIFPLIYCPNIPLVSYLTQVALGIIFCYCNTFASRFDMFFIQKFSSVYLHCNELLLKLSISLNKSNQALSSTSNLYLQNCWNFLFSDYSL